ALVLVICPISNSVPTAITSTIKLSHRSWDSHFGAVVPRLSNSEIAMLRSLPNRRPRFRDGVEQSPLEMR
ncbi:MAG: hypothetical protein ACRDWS_00630, partial [Acidimicrobiia bacterium]